MKTESRRPAVTVLVVGVVAGAAMILAMQAFREPLREWLVENPAQTASRATLLIAAAGSLLVVPLLAFAAYLVRMAAKMEAPRATQASYAQSGIHGTTVCAMTPWVRPCD